MDMMQVIGFLATKEDWRAEFLKLYAQGLVAKPKATANELKRRGWMLPDSFWASLEKKDGN